MTTSTVSVPRKALAALNAELRRQDEPTVRGAERAWLEVEYDEDDFDAYDMAQALVRWRRSSVEVEPPDERFPTPPELAAFQLARSLQRAVEADDEPDVQRFRQEVLGGRLLKREEVAPWVERQAADDGPATTFVLVKMPPSWQRGDSLDGATNPVASFEILEHASEDGWVVPVPVNVDGVLGRLRVLSVRLAKSYAWQQGQAIMYVLTGATPVVPMLRTRVSDGTVPKVTLEVDPDVPADVVAEAHKRARRELLGPKPRTPSARAVELVRFAAEHPTLRPLQLWCRWNDNHDELERYDDARSFRRALRDARRRVDGVPNR